jgi:hypothetical protein
LTKLFSRLKPKRRERVRSQSPESLPVCDVVNVVRHRRGKQFDAQVGAIGSQPSLRQSLLHDGLDEPVHRECAVAAIIRACDDQRDLGQGAEGAVDIDRGKLGMREDCERDRHWRQHRGHPKDFLRLGARFDTDQRIALDDALQGNRECLAHTAAIGASRLVVEP